MELVSGREAAERLGVSVRQAQRLAKDGRLTFVGVDRIDFDSVLRLVAQRQGHHRRVWTEPTAWAVVALLTGQAASWLGQPQRSRLRKVLGDVDAAELVARTRNRAEVRRFRSHPAAVGRLRPQLWVTGAGAELGDLTASTSSSGVDGYVDAGEVDSLVRRFRLVGDPTGNVTLRVTSVGRRVVEPLVDSEVLAALDLATSGDDRERVAAFEVLEDHLRSFRG